MFSSQLQSRRLPFPVPSLAEEKGETKAESAAPKPKAKPAAAKPAAKAAKPAAKAAAPAAKEADNGAPSAGEACLLERQRWDRLTGFFVIDNRMSASVLYFYTPANDRLPIERLLKDLRLR